MRWPKILFIFILSIQSLCSYAQIPGFFLDEDTKRLHIPFFDLSDLIIINVTINGSMPLNFLLDTGVKANLLFSKSLGDELDLQYTRKLNLMGADGIAILSASISPNNSLKISGLNGFSQTLLVLDEEFVSLDKVLGIPIHGVIGHEFFKFNPVKIDYDNKIITFYKPSALKRKPLTYKKLKMELHNGKPYINSKVDQAEGPPLHVKLLVDTGANHGLLLNPETSDKIIMPKEVIESELGTSLGGELSGVIGRVPLIRIGKLKFRKVITSYPDETQFSDIIIETGRQGAIGSDIISKTKIIFDYPHERIFYQTGANYRKVFEYDMSGITVRLMPTSEKRLYVHHLRSGSPADVIGMKVGDEIMSVNGLPTEFWQLSSIVEMLRSKEGKKVKMVVQRKKGDVVLTLNKNITLQRQI